MSQRPLPEPRPLAAILQSGPIALFLDFDGTLVEIAPTPESIVIPPSFAERLAELATRLESACAIVSGRAHEDISRHLGGRMPLACAGSHGADIRDASGELLGHPADRLPATIAREMRAYAAAEGLGFEEKPHGAALHYRAQPEKGREAWAFAERLAQEHGWIAQGGKAVVELVAGKTDKGQAVRAFMARAPFAGAQPWFIGDDLTDEHGFAACSGMGGAGVIVGDREPTAAAFRLPDVASVHRWLEL